MKQPTHAPTPGANKKGNQVVVRLSATNPSISEVTLSNQNKSLVPRRNQCSSDYMQALGVWIDAGGPFDGAIVVDIRPVPSRDKVSSALARFIPALAKTTDAYPKGTKQPTRFSGISISERVEMLGTAERPSVVMRCHLLFRSPTGPKNRMACWKGVDGLVLPSLQLDSGKNYASRDDGTTTTTRVISDPVKLKQYHAGLDHLMGDVFSVGAFDEQGHAQLWVMP